MSCSKCAYCEKIPDNDIVLISNRYVKTKSFSVDSIYFEPWHKKPEPEPLILLFCKLGPPPFCEVAKGEWCYQFKESFSSKKEQE